MDDTSPSFVKSLIPDACCVRVNVEFARFLTDEANAFVEDAFPKIMLDEIHLVNEAKDDSRRTILLQSFDDLAVSDEIALEFARLNVKDVDQNGDFGENVLALSGEVALVKGILSVEENFN